MPDCAVILIIDPLLASIRECFGVSEDQINEPARVLISRLRRMSNTMVRKYGRRGMISLPAVIFLLSLDKDNKIRQTVY